MHVARTSNAIVYVQICNNIRDVLMKLLHFYSTRPVLKTMSLFIVNLFTIDLTAQQFYLLQYTEYCTIYFPVRVVHNNCSKRWSSSIVNAFKWPVCHNLFVFLFTLSKLNDLEGGFGMLRTGNIGLGLGKPRAVNATGMPFWTNTRLQRSTVWQKASGVNSLRQDTDDPVTDSLRIIKVVRLIGGLYLNRIR